MDVSEVVASSVAMLAATELGSVDNVGGTSGDAPVDVFDGYPTSTTPDSGNTELGSGVGIVALAGIGGVTIAATAEDESVWATVSVTVTVGVDDAEISFIPMSWGTNLRPVPEDLTSSRTFPSVAWSSPAPSRRSVAGELSLMGWREPEAASYEKSWL